MISSQNRLVICKRDADGDISGGRDCLAWSDVKF